MQAKSKQGGSHISNTTHKTDNTLFWEGELLFGMHLYST